MLAEGPAQDYAHVGPWNIRDCIGPQRARVRRRHGAWTLKTLQVLVGHGPLVPWTLGQRAVGVTPPWGRSGSSEATRWGDRTGSE